MADISKEINDFKNAIYGEEVRGSMITLAEKVNTEVETNTTNVNAAVSTANTASSKANQTLETAQEAIDEAETTLQAANTAKADAQSSAEAAAASASAAEASKTAAAQSAAAAAASAAEAEQVAEGLGGFNGSAASVTAVDTQGMVVETGENTNAQALFNALALKVAQELVSNEELAQQLASYVAKTDIVQTESTATNKVPSSAYLKTVKDTINSNFEKYYSLSDAIQIPSGADLNNYTDFGNYVSSAASISSTLQNCPALNGGFVLHVERVTGATDGTFLKQRIIYNEAKSLEFWRVKTGKESWSSWVSPITNADVQKGSTAGISCAKNAITESTITFPKAFGSAPKVVVSFYSNTTSVKYGMLTPMVCDVTTTNFKVRLANAADVDLTPAIYWIAAI